MTRPRITVVDVPVKAMTTGKRKAAGKPKSWRIVRHKPFGNRISINMPDDCDMLLVCVDTVQHIPVRIYLSHQVSPTWLKKLMREHDAKSVTLMPYRNDDKVEIKLTDLDPPKPQRRRK